LESRVVEAGQGAMLLTSAAAGRLRATSPMQGIQGDTVWVALRPEKLRIAHEPPAASDENCVAGPVSNNGYLGDGSVYEGQLHAGHVMKAAVANMPRMIERPIGWDDRVWLTWSPEAAVVLTR